MTVVRGDRLVPGGIAVVRGPAGPTGPAGPGTPAGGATGRVLAKASATDYDTAWTDLSGTYVLLGKKNRRQREVGPLWTTLPQTHAPAADIPTAATSGPGGASPISGGSPTSLPYNTPLVTGLGTVDVGWNALSTDYLQNQCSGNAGAGATPCARSFDYYGLDLAIRFRNGVSNGSRFWVFVDGLPTTAAPVASSAATPNNLHFYRLTWGTAKTRRVTVYTENLDFGGLDVNPSDTVVAAPRPAFSIYGLGDSWIAGAGATTALVSLGFTVARALGAEFYCGGWAGTGYWGGGANIYGSAGRTAKIAAANPDWLWAFGSVNDGAVPDTPTMTTSATTGLTAIKAAAPNARLLLTSVQSVTGSPTAQNIANDATMATVAASLGFTVVGRPISEGWITGTGRVGATNGSGNADVFANSDATPHLSPAGHDYYARRILNALTATLPL